MKKVLLFAATLLLSATMFAQAPAKGEIRCDDQTSGMTKGETKDGSWGTFTNFTATDMNGDSHDIQAYLDAGKYVVIDFFCAWCSPCYAFHQTATLENLYNTYGQGGTNEFVVLYVEGETTNTAAQISGTSTAQTYAGASAGDFTNGGTNPIPIIDATTNLVYNVSIYDGYVPRVYLFCPSGFVYQMYGVVNSSAEAYYNFAISSCPSETSKPIVELNIPDVIKKGEPAAISAEVTSVGDYTLAWTFEGGSPATATSESVNVTWNTTGQHTITLVATNANGSTTENVTVNVVDCSAGISQFPFTEDFENGQGCWDFQSANNTNTDDYFGIIELNDGSYCAILNSYNSASDYNQYLISPLLNHNTELEVSFSYMKGSSYSGGEKFTVKYSTTDKNLSSFVALSDEITASSTNWTTYTGTLPANAKYFMINYNTNYEYFLLIDDITFTAVGGGNQGINDVTSASSVKLYPNPTTGNLYIDAEGLQKVEVIDAAGRIVMTETNSQVNMGHLANGVYTVRVTANGNSTIQKVVKK